LYHVQAVVLLDGEPLAWAEVSLISVQEDGKHATGMTDAEGRVTFKTAEVEGVFPDTYIVTVYKTTEESLLSNSEIRALAEVGVRFRPDTISLIPEKYTSRETSDLNVRIGYWHPKELTLNLWSEGFTH
jgi:hypothetical protein